MKIKIATVLGARPQFVKAAVVSHAFARHNRFARPGIDERIIHTGQHFDDNMSGIFFEEMGIPRPAYHLGLGGGTHGAMTGRMLEAIEVVLNDEDPHLVLVYGDTNSTLAGALAAAKLHIPVAHVEAGLRSFNRRMPEEVNRVLTDHVSELLFAPTEAAVANLRREGMPEERISQVGDVMLDAAIFYGERAEAKSTVLRDLGLSPNGYVLATCHRAENTDSTRRLTAIFAGLKDVARDLPVVLPLHPRTRLAVERLGLGNGRLHIVEPLGYLDMVMLEKNARLIATDSGGVQKEAFFHRVTCITLRDETEWVELVELGWNRLAPPSSGEQVAASIRNALDLEPSEWSSPYGSGDSADRIVDVLVERLAS